MMMRNDIVFCIKVAARLTWNKALGCVYLPEMASAALTEEAFYIDDRNRWVLTWSVVRGVAKIGLSKCFYSSVTNEFVTDNAFFMTVDAWRALTEDKKLLDKIKSLADAHEKTPQSSWGLNIHM